MLKEIRKQLLALRLEFHWWFILRYRKRLAKMYDAGESLSSPRILQLNNKASYHCVFVMKNEKRFEDIYLS